MRIVWKNKDQLLSRIQNVGRRFPKRLKSGLRIEAEIDMTESKRRVPVEHGVLRASGYVSETEQSGNNFYVELGYGGAAEDYAIVQHERLDFKHPRGGQAKFLESVINESRDTILERLAKRIHLDKDFV